eukprot:3446255-Rhodomonas_salina.3
MIQGMCSGSEVMQELGLGGRVRGGGQGVGVSGVGGMEGGGEEDGQKWKKVASEMHSLLVDQVLPPTGSHTVG